MLVIGGPTFIGTALGHSFTSEPVSVVLLSLAAGSIVYVIAQLLGVAARAKRTDLLAGFITDAIVTAGGAWTPASPWGHGDRGILHLGRRAPVVSGT